MKIFSILAISLLLTNVSFAQEDSEKSEVISTKIANELKVFGAIKADINKVNKSSLLGGLRLELGTILKNNMYISIGGYTNLYTELTVDGSNGAPITVNSRTDKPENISTLTEVSLKFGYADAISGKTRIIPYIGIGYQTVEKTTVKLEQQISSLDVDITSLSVSSNTTNYYSVEDASSIVIPLGVDIHFHGGRAGFVFGPYINISKHTSLGFNLGIAFGKL